MLDETQRDRLLRLFSAGAELPTANRAAFVERECGDDPAIRRELFDLLELEADDDGLLAEPVIVGIPENAAEFAAAVQPSPTITPIIDGYADLEPIAEGGMGTVYRARQLEPVRRTVAIKIIRSGADTEDVLQRFAAERQALARMSHPYIAAVHDAGMDTTGRPFLAMEFVDGQPITDFCAAERLQLAERLELFIKVCQGVDHAHRRGVLHRDLKPSNVLVSRSGSEVIPKVIDFGIAKATEGSLSEHTLHTMAGSILGTPEYMSPEQMEGSAQDLDTRSDVYSLGVILYELLTHVRPIDEGRLRSVGLSRLTTILRDEVPKKPSTRLRELTTPGTHGPTPAGDPRRWARRLEGDLDWIVMCALEKEPERRYGSPHELAADLDNFLADRPVTAGPPTGWYRVRKFTRRYRIQVAAALLVLVSLIVGLSGTIWFLFEAKESERIAQSRAIEADGVRMATEAALLVEEDPNVALLLALQASERTQDYTVNQTVHQALPQQSLVAELDGHDHGARQCIFLSDGRLLTRGPDPSVLLWHVESGRVLRRFTGARMADMAVDSDERRLLTVSQDGSASVWDLASGERLVHIDGVAGGTSDGAFTPDGSLLAIASRAGLARVFDAHTGKQLHSIRHSTMVLGVALDAKGTRLATRARDRVTRVFDLADGSLLHEIGGGPTDQSNDHMVRFSPRGDRIVSHESPRRGEQRLLVHDLTAKQLTEVRGAAGPCFVDADRLFFHRRDGWGLVDLRTGEVTEHRRTDGKSFAVLRPSPDLRSAVAVNERNDLCLLDLATNTELRGLRGDDDKRARYRDVAFHPDGRRFAVTGRRVRIYKEPEFAPTQIPVGAGRLTAPGTVCGPRAVILLRPDPAKTEWTVWSHTESQRLATIAEPDLTGLRVSPCGTRLVGIRRRAGENPTHAAVVFDVEGRPRREIPLPRGFDQFGLRTDGRVLVATSSATDSKRSQFFDVETGAAKEALPFTFARDWSPGQDFDRLVQPRYSLGYTEVFDRRSGDRIGRATLRYGTHTVGAVTADGRYLLTVIAASWAVVWDLTTGGALTPIATYANLRRSNTNACGFAAGGRLAWVLCANEVHVFETATARPFTVLRLDSPALSANLSTDGSQLITVTNNGRCERWPLHPIAVAKRLTVGRLSARDLELFRIGTPADWRVREREQLLASPTPRNLARLGQLALAGGDRDAAIERLQAAVARGLMRPHDRDVQFLLFDLLCQRLGDTGGSEQQRTADTEAALTALEKTVRWGFPLEEVLGLPSIRTVRDLPRFQALLQK